MASSSRAFVGEETARGGELDGGGGGELGGEVGEGAAVELSMNGEVRELQRTTVELMVLTMLSGEGCRGLATCEVEAAAREKLQRAKICSRGALIRPALRRLGCAGWRKSSRARRR